jgi:hypothetical protein
MTSLTSHQNFTSCTTRSNLHFKSDDLPQNMYHVYSTNLLCYLCAPLLIAQEVRIGGLLYNSDADPDPHRSAQFWGARSGSATE